jgi:hypothetical protein
MGVKDATFEKRELWRVFGKLVTLLKEEILCSNHTSDSVKGNSTESASFFVLAFEEKRAERAHLLVGFSPILNFFRLYLVFICGWCVSIYFVSLFFPFNIFHTF